ncbi:hypothetical protein SLA2020_407060 [Shorea laevis]
MDLCDGLLAPSFSNALKIADPPRKPLSSPPSLPEAPVLLGMESEKQFLSVEGCSGMEAGWFQPCWFLRWEVQLRRWLGPRSVLCCGSCCWDRIGSGPGAACYC